MFKGVEGTPFLLVAASTVGSIYLKICNKRYGFFFFFFD